MVKGAVIGGLNARRGTIIDSEVREDEFTAVAEVALNDMFGYSNQLRGATQGKGEFSMEYKVPCKRLFFPYNRRFDVGCRTTCRYCQMFRLSCRRIIVNLCRTTKSRLLGGSMPGKDFSFSLVNT
jgi:hypothetical protein